jgi:Icc-related predicted phosphoesterase
LDRLRIIYVADFHGSETVWRKWISAQSMYNIDVSIVAGDLSGKMIVPVIREDDGTYTCRHEGRVEKASNEDEREDIMNRLRARGIYPYLSSSGEVQKLKSDSAGVDRLFSRVISAELDRLMTLAEEKIPSDKTIIVTPGNDDIADLDEVIKKHKRIVNPLGQAVKLPLGYEMISMEYTSSTPWNTPRECSEEELARKLEDLVPLTSGNWNKTICNFHCPPHGTRLDLAPKLDKNLKPVYSLGNPVYANVGCMAVRRFLEKYQPILSLHGHIHEASGIDQIGKTTAFNPGSEYTSGVFKAIVVELDENKITDWFKIG